MFKGGALSFHVFAYILSSKGAKQLQVLYIRTLGNIQGNVSNETAVRKCIRSNFFLKICRSFRTTSKKLFLENYALAYHTADKDHAYILWIVFPIFFVCFVCLISIEIIKIKRIPMKEIGYNFIYSIDQKVSPACQPDFLKLWRVCILLYKNQEILA